MHNGKERQSKPIRGRWKRQVLLPSLRKMQQLAGGTRVTDHLRRRGQRTCGITAAGNSGSGSTHLGFGCTKRAQRSAPAAQSRRLPARLGTGGPPQHQQSLNGGSRETQRHMCKGGWVGHVCV